MRDSSVPDLETARTRLRRLTVEDADDMFAYASDPEVTRYVAWETHPCVEHTVGYLMAVAEAYERGGHLDWGVVLRESGRLIGTCGFPSVNREHDVVELGYVFARPWWGMGIATECASVLVAYAFDRLDANRVEAFCVPENVASARVMEKLGMHREGLLRERVLADGRYRDVFVYSTLRRERGQLSGDKCR